MISRGTDKFLGDLPVSRKLVDLIERSAKELAKNCVQDLQKHFRTPTYKQFDEQDIYERAFDVYSHLGKWISYETNKDEIAKKYVALGKQRHKEGFALSEVIQALIIVRRHLWIKVLDEGLLDNVVDLYQAIELNNRVTVFFDRAIIYTAAGYEQQG